MIVPFYFDSFFPAAFWSPPSPSQLPALLAVSLAMVAMEPGLGLLAGMAKALPAAAFDAACCGA
jgi:hypothetical protein